MSDLEWHQVISFLALSGMRGDKKKGIAGG